MQAILTKFIPATNTKGDRIKATCAAGSITVSFHYGDSCAHNAAVTALLEKLGWNCSFVSGDLPGGVVSVMYSHRFYDHPCTSDAHNRSLTNSGISK